MGISTQPLPLGRNSLEVDHDRIAGLMTKWANYQNQWFLNEVVTGRILSSFEYFFNKSEILVLKDDKRGDIGNFSQKVESDSYYIAQ